MRSEKYLVRSGKREERELLPSNQWDSYQVSEEWKTERRSDGTGETKLNTKNEILVVSHDKKLCQRK